MHDDEVDNAFAEDDSGEIVVGLTLNKACVRTLYYSVCRAYDTWPGGDPEEQINLEKTKNSLYAVYMELLYRSDFA